MASLSLLRVLPHCHTQARWFSGSTCLCPHGTILVQGLCKLMTTSSGRCSRLMYLTSKMYPDCMMHPTCKALNNNQGASGVHQMRACCPLLAHVTYLRHTLRQTRLRGAR